jgi:hypothetical protein
MSLKKGVLVVSKAAGNNRKKGLPKTFGFNEMAENTSFDINNRRLSVEISTPLPSYSLYLTYVSTSLLFKHHYSNIM